MAFEVPCRVRRAAAQHAYDFRDSSRRLPAQHLTWKGSIGKIYYVNIPQGKIGRSGIVITAIVCDDEKRVLEEICAKIKAAFDGCGSEAEVCAFDDPFALVERLKSSAPQALFLDIDMPRLGGMDIAQYIIDNNLKTLLVFVTSHDALVYSSFQYRPFAFIRKSRLDEEIVPVVERMIAGLQKDSEFFTFKNSEGVFRVPLDDILYFESDSNYIDLHCSERVYRFRGTIASLEGELAGNGFIRIHKGFLVNERRVYALMGDELRLDSGELLPVGRTNRESVKKAIMRYLR